MRLCFDLARKGAGKVSPNPLVGCVVVKDDVILATGFHQKYGAPHAEADALSKITNDQSKGATLYCNLEPCSHTNKQTPPCAPLLLKRGISKVVISNVDNNPHVNGTGIELLKNAGIEVITGVLEQEGLRLNEIFFTNMSKRRNLYRNFFRINDCFSYIIKQYIRIIYN